MTSCLCFRHIFPSKKKYSEVPEPQEKQATPEEKRTMTTAMASQKVELPRLAAPPRATPQQSARRGRAASSPAHCCAPS